jgi:mannose-6-phosphate isomerase class I
MSGDEPFSPSSCRSPRADRANHSSCKSEFAKLNAFTKFDQVEFDLCAEELSKHVAAFVLKHAQLLKSMEQTMHKQIPAAMNRLSEIDSVLDVNTFTGTDEELLDLKQIRRGKVLALQAHILHMDTLKDQIDGLRAIGARFPNNQV